RGGGQTGPARFAIRGESRGAAVARWLAPQDPPAGLVLQSAFTSLRDMARVHYPWAPAALVGDGFPSLDRVPKLRVPVLILHGERDEIVPVAQGRALYAAAPEPRRLEVVAGAGHNDLVDVMGASYGTVVAEWLESASRAGPTLPPDVDCAFPGGVMLRSYKGISPRLGAGVYVEPSAQVIADVELG